MEKKIKIIITNEKGDELHSTMLPTEDAKGLFEQVVFKLLNGQYVNSSSDDNRQPETLSINITYKDKSVTINMFASKDAINHALGQIAFSHSELFTNERFRIYDDCDHDEESLYFHPELFYDRN